MKPARYSTQEFPDYRYIPGEKTPHPTENPLGHSFGVKHDSSDEDTFLYGVDLYNNHYWWEAHEAWESLWQKTNKKSLDAQFLQGLIKISAAFLKWEGKSRRGLQILYNDGLSHLKNVLDGHELYRGVDLMEYISRLSSHFMEVVADEDSWPDPLKNYPYILLKKQ